MRRRSLVRVPRKTKEWVGFWTYPTTPTEAGPISLAAGSYFADWIVTPNAAIDQFDEPTVLRLIFNYIAPYNGFAAGGYNQIHMGIIVTRDTDSAGGTPLYDPIYQGFWDWLWTFNAMAGAPSGAAAASTAQFSNGLYFDIKSRRKIEPGEGLLFVATNPNSGAASQLQLSGRVLLAHA